MAELLGRQALFSVCNKNVRPKGERYALYQQASPFGDKRQLVRGCPPKTPQYERMDYTMYEALFFVIGLIIGGMAGVLTMCIIQINHNEKEDTHE